MAVKNGGRLRKQRSQIRIIPFIGNRDFYKQNYLKEKFFKVSNHSEIKE